MISSLIRSTAGRGPGRHLRGRRAALVGLLLAVSGLLSGCNGQASEGAPGKGAMGHEVSVVTLHPKSVTITSELPGRTAASLVAEVRPQVGGIIRERLFKEGGEVEAGDILYQIDPSTYQASYDAASAVLQKSEAVVPSAQAKVERYENLVRQSAVSKQEVDDAQSELLQAKADVASAKADVETAKINLDHTTVRAPISGRIGVSTVTVGALVTANQETALTTIRTLDPINVDVTQSSTNLLKLRRAVTDGRISTSGEDVAVKLKLEDGTIYGRVGKLEFMDSVIDQATGTFTVRAEFANPDRLLLPGMYVRGILEEGVSEGSYLVPQRAVSHGRSGEATALFVDADGKAERRTLTVERSVGNNWLVDGGVSDGDRLVVEGGASVEDGQSVKVTEVRIDDVTGVVEPVPGEAVSPQSGAG